MSRNFRRALVAFVVLALVVLGVTRLSVWMLRYEPSCKQPCHDLGKDLDHPACNPAALILDATPASTKAGKVTELFFRVTLTNQSCYVISTPASGFLWYRDQSQMRAGVPYSIHIVGPQGEIHSTPTLSKIELYTDLETNEGKFRSAKGAVPDQNGAIQLMPGDSITSNAAVLSPYRTEVRDQDEPDGNIATNIVRVPVPVPASAVAPPSGFNVIDNLRFDVPGKFSVQAVYDEAQIGTLMKPVHPLARYVPSRFVRLLESLDVWHGSYFQSYKFEARSNIVEFEVGR